MPTLPIAYTWALAGSAVAPASGRQATGWLLNDEPPSSAENWLQQQNGASATWIAETFAIVGGERVLTMGLVNVGLRASSDGSVATFHFDGSGGGLDTLVRMDSVQAGDAYIGGPSGNTNTVYLSAAGPATVGIGGGADVRVLRVLPQGGVPVAALGVGMVVPTASAAALSGAGVGRDAGIYADNYVKAVGFCGLSQTAGSLALTTSTPGINVGVPTYPTDRLLIPVSDWLAGRIKGVVVPTVTMRAVGAISSPVSASASWNAGTGNIEVFVSYFSGGAWQGFHVGAGTAHADISVTLY